MIVKLMSLPSPPLLFCAHSFNTNKKAQNCGIQNQNVVCVYRNGTSQY
jgi:hypothetical protein